MAKDITQYFSNVAPIASAGGVMTPYREAPPMTPINIESDKFAAMGKLGKAVENVGEDLQKIKNSNENDIATIALMDFKKQGVAEIREFLKVQGPEAVASGDNPGVTAKFYAKRQEQAENFIDNLQVSDVMKKAAAKALSAAIFEEANHISAHETRQNAIVKQQAIDATVADAAATIRANPLDDSKVAAATNGAIQILAVNAPGDRISRDKAIFTLVDARLDGLIIKDPDKAVDYLEANKALLGDKYDTMRKKVTFAQIERDSLISPGMTLDRLGQRNEGEYSYYKTLSPTERVAAISGVISQVSARNHLQDLEVKRNTEDSSYGFYSIINSGKDPANPENVIGESRRSLAATSYLQERLYKRLISVQQYEHLIASAKQGITTDFDRFQQLKIGVSLGKVSVNEITSATGIGAGDKAALLDQRRSINNAMESLSIQKRQEVNTVRQAAHTMMIPTGYRPSDEQMKSFLKFNADLNDAAAKGQDPNSFYFENAWKYMKNAIPNTKYGMPNTIEAAQMIENQAFTALNNNEITQREYNDIAERIAQAKRILKTREQQKTDEKRKVK